METTKKRKRLLPVMILCLVALLAATAVTAILPAAAEAQGETVGIKAAFDGKYLVQDVKTIANDGYVGEIRYSIYYDRSNGDVVPGINGTPIIVYAVNTAMERVGRDSNEVILQSMLDRGYVVVVLDYLGNPAAVSPALDNSAQAFTYKMETGAYFDKKTDADSSPVFPKSGTYKEIFLVPSGHNVLLHQVFWELDKHGVDGSLEKVVETWNNDFKGVKGNSLVKWATGEDVASRKKVAAASDGTDPVWYNASGALDANGLYTKVKYTVPEVFTDCVNPDGSPLETELYMHIVYPTHPAKEVPLLAVASCAGYPHTLARSIEACAHHTGALFRGYAGAVYDYLWFPMARDASFGYYDGNVNTAGSVTGDHMNYSLHLYNDKLINTAALRCLRYLALSESETYRFDEDKYTVIGLSKGGWFSFLGEQVLQSDLVDGAQYATVDELEDAIDLKLASFIPRRYLDGHHGETRYQAGNTETYEAGVYVGANAVEGGERQPWLTYNGEQIRSGAQFTYAANGSQQEDLSAGHSPIYIAAHLYDDYGAAYGSANVLRNLSRTLDIPSVFFEVALPHCYAYGYDEDYGVDTYDAFFSFLTYYMQDGPAEVLYITPGRGEGNVPVTGKITVQFAGEVSLEEVAAGVSVSSDAGAVSGSWSAAYGGTEWTFAPDGLTGGTRYTVTVSASLKGKNGTALGRETTAVFYTGYDVAAETAASATAAGNFFTLTAPALPEAADRFVLRFRVANEAANIADVYAVAAVGETDGTLLGSVNLAGRGSYEVDVTDYVCRRTGEQITFLVKARKASGETVVLDQPFNGTLGGATVYSRVPAKAVMLDAENAETTDAAAAATTAVRFTVSDNEGSYVRDVFYENVATAMTYGSLLGNAAITRADYGRRFEITLRVYDTISRTIQLKTNSRRSATAARPAKSRPSSLASGSGAPSLSP